MSVADRLLAMEQEIASEISRRPPDLRLPSAGMRFKAAQDIDIQGATYLQLPMSDGIVPIDTWNLVLVEGDVVYLCYQPQVQASTHCSLIAERYEYYEARCVKQDLVVDPGYVGFAFSISYLQLDQSFVWLPFSKLPLGLPERTLRLANYFRVAMEAGK
jgi:hypothetical protein